MTCLDPVWRSSRVVQLSRCIAVLITGSLILPASAPGLEEEGESIFPEDFETAECANWSATSNPIGAPDGDADGYGDIELSAPWCQLPDGWASNAEDCDDFDESIHPNATELCNSLDDDCDGENDEPFPDLGLPCQSGIGACEATGVVICDGSGVGTKCSAEAGAPTEELCDEVDNDCDGVANEGFSDLGSACQAGLGECLSFGQMVCSESGVETVCNAVPGQPESEVCDGLDNDCDGVADDACKGG